MSPDAQRVLIWDGCVNVRDLGGLPLAGGGHTRFRQIVRADSIRGLTDAGWRSLLDYGVRAAIDLRGPHELDEDVAGDPPIPIVNIRVTPEQGTAAWSWPSMLEAYLAIIERYPVELAEVIQSVAREDAPIVIHCQGGRDRTGISVALLLRLAGVDPETIAADHALSDESWAPYNLPWFEEAPDDDERARRRRIAAPAGRAMAEVLEEVDRRYGGVESYLLGGGASSDELRRVRGRLRP